MSNQAIFISHGGVGEVHFKNKNWYKHDSSDFDKDKSIPFIKLLNILLVLEHFTTVTKLEREDTKISHYWQKILWKKLVNYSVLIIKLKS